MLNLIFAPLKIITKTLSSINPLILSVLVIATLSYFTYYYYSKSNNFQEKFIQNQKISQDLKEELEKVKSTDQIKRNDNLQKEIGQIHDTFLKSSTTYEQLFDFKGKQKETLNKDYAKSLKLLSDKNFSEAEKNLDNITKIIAEENKKLIANTTTSLPTNVPVNNAPPNSGFSQQKVHIDSGDYLVSIISADLNSTKVIVDTASDSDCKDNCPVLSLQDFVSRSGAFAGINGSFFCPAAYPSCAGKTNSFDTLLMNKNKHYFNSENNVYSVVPAVVFSNGSIRFLTRSLDWGRDQGIDSMIANYPLYLVGGNVQFSSNGDPKIDSAGARTFIGSKDNMVYIGIVYGASAGQAAQVLKALGLQNALGLDQGGSTALWHSGYKAGPGRGIPNAILFIKK